MSLKDCTTGAKVSLQSTLSSIALKMAETKIDSESQSPQNWVVLCSVIVFGGASKRFTA